MKRAIYSAIIILSALLLSSCRGVDGLDGRDGRDGKDGVFSHVDIITIHVEKKEWEYSGLPNNNYFVAEVNMPEITRDVFNGGIVKMYRFINFGTTDVMQTEMPYSNHVEEYVNDEWVFYNEKVDYDFTIGKIYIYFQVSDFDYEIDESYVPEKMDFRCVVAY